MLPCYSVEIVTVLRAATFDVGSFLEDSRVAARQELFNVDLVVHEELLLFGSVRNKGERDLVFGLLHWSSAEEVRLVRVPLDYSLELRLHLIKLRWVVLFAPALAHPLLFVVGKGGRPHHDRLHVLVHSFIPVCSAQQLRNVVVSYLFL